MANATGFLCNNGSKMSFLKHESLGNDQIRLIYMYDALFKIVAELQILASMAVLQLLGP